MTFFAAGVIGIQIRGTEAAAVGGGEFDDADDLAGSVCVRGKNVDFGKLVGGEYFGSKRARLVAAGRLRNPEVRPGVRPGVEAEDRLHDGSEFGGNRGVLVMAAIARLAVHVRFEVHAEGLFHSFHFADQVHCPAGHARIRDRQAMSAGELLDLVQVRPIGPVQRGVLFTSQVPPMSGQLRGQITHRVDELLPRRPGPHAHRQVNDLGIFAFLAVFRVVVFNGPALP